MEAAYSSLSYFLILGLLTLIGIIIILAKKKTAPGVYFLSFSALALLLSSSPPKTLNLFLLFISFHTLLILAHKKYQPQINSNFFVTLALLPLLLLKLKLVAFLAASYSTFRILQLHFDIKDKRLSQFKISSFILFATFFPTFSSGPIDRYENFLKQINQDSDWKTVNEGLNSGLKLILLGLLYKFIIAYYAHQLYSLNDQELIILKFSKIYSYSIFLFFDFAGYSLLAIGFSKCLGINVSQNFNKPFLSTSMKEFWQRWHISLSEWFRDYIFMRFVIWQRKQNKRINKTQIICVGLLLSFGLMGIWHGFNKYYFIYGVYQGSALILNELWQNYRLKHNIKPIHPLIAWFLTMNTACFGLYLFSLG